MAVLRRIQTFNPNQALPEGFVPLTTIGEGANANTVALLGGGTLGQGDIDEINRLFPTLSGQFQPGFSLPTANVPQGTTIFNTQQDIGNTLNQASALTGGNPNAPSMTAFNQLTQPQQPFDMNALMSQFMEMLNMAFMAPPPGTPPTGATNQQQQLPPGIQMTSSATGHGGNQQQPFAPPAEATGAVGGFPGFPPPANQNFGATGATTPPPGFGGGATGPQQQSVDNPFEFFNTPEFQNFLFSTFSQGIPPGILSPNFNNFLNAPGPGGFSNFDLFNTGFNLPTEQLAQLGPTAFAGAQIRNLQNTGFPGQQGIQGQFPTLDQQILGLLTGQPIGGIGGEIQNIIANQGITPEFQQAAEERILNPQIEALRGNLNRQGGGVADPSSGVFQELERRSRQDFSNDLILAGQQNLNNALNQGRLFEQGLFNQQLGGFNTIAGQGLNLINTGANIGQIPFNQQLAQQQLMNDLFRTQTAAQTGLGQSFLEGSFGQQSFAEQFLPLLLSGFLGGGLGDLLDIFRGQQPGANQPGQGGDQPNLSDDPSLTEIFAGLGIPWLNDLLRDIILGSPQPIPPTFGFPSGGGFTPPFFFSGGSGSPFFDPTFDVGFRGSSPLDLFGVGGGF